MKANNDQWWFYGITKDPTKNDLLLVYRYDSNLPESLLGVTLKYTIDGLIYKLHNTLNELIIKKLFIFFFLIFLKLIKIEAKITMIYNYSNYAKQD